MSPRVMLLLSVLCSLASARNQPASKMPPNNIPVANAPMFISFGFDDNSHSGISTGTAKTGGIKWVCDFTKDLKNPVGSGQKETYDGAPVRCSFYSNSYYMEPYHGDYSNLVKWAHNYAYRLGHEIGNHTHSHITGGNGPTLSVSGWESEIKQCNGWLTKKTPALGDSISIADKTDEGAGIPSADIVGFRSPYLRYGNALFTALKTNGFKYDCSIEEGLDPSQDGTNFYWPYTMENVSPGHDYMVNDAGTKEASYYKPEHPGLWQLPCYAVVAPKDEDCAKYGIAPGFRKKLKDHFVALGKGGGFDIDNGKITGLDYNWYYFQEFKLSKAEALGVLKYTLDLRMKGNRCPMLLGVHSQYYTEIWNSNATNCSDPKDRQAIIEEFVAYALKTYPDVRIVPMNKVMEWCEKPVALKNTTAISPGSVSVQNTFVQNGNQISVNSSKTVDAKLFTLNGRLLATQKVDPVDGVCSWDLDTHAAKGNYILSIDNLTNLVTIQ